MANADQRNGNILSPARREAIVRQYWLKGDLTPLAVANTLAGQRAAQPV